MSTITSYYEGELRTLCTHESSGQTLRTDAPKDNHGKGEYFSPTDLLATALGSCILTLMGIAAQKYQVDITGAHVSVEKIMSSTPPRRINTLTVAVQVPQAFDVAIQAGIEKAALTCPVHESLHPDIKQNIIFTWGE